MPSRASYRAFACCVVGPFVDDEDCIDCIDSIVQVGIDDPFLCVSYLYVVLLRDQGLLHVHATFCAGWPASG